MKKITVLSIIALSFVAVFAAACSSGSNPTTTTTNTINNQTKTTNTNAATNTAPNKTEEDAPASVKAVFPDAQSFTKQHKDLTKDQIAAIEKETNAKVPDTDHHSYLAFSTTGGARKQIGAATIVKAGGKEIVIIYDNKEGRPFIKEIRADGVSADFLKQFAGKNHDDKFLIGTDLKTNGVDEPLAKAIAEAVRVDAMTMQTLYGAADNH
ncbi:MAG: hypothetical protein ABJA66_14935 [Actinomycetota bacterium]